MKRNLLLFAFILLSYNALQAQHSKPLVGLPTHRIVMQLTSSDTLVFKGLMKQMQNLTSAWGDSVQIELVCHGPGIDFLKNVSTARNAKIQSLIQLKVDVVACENTLKERNIPRESLVPGIRYVRLGIGEIVMKQEQGWSYIKAGF